MNAFGKGKNRVQAVLERSQALAAGLSESPESERSLAIEQIIPNPHQPRRHFSSEKMEELAASIRENGVLQPIMVRPREKGQYEIVFGERRYRAAQMAGLTRIPAVIREMSDEELEVIAALENLQRENLTKFEEVTYKLRLVSGLLEVTPDQAQIRLRALRAAPEKDPEAVEALVDLFAKLGREKWTSFVTNGLPILKLAEPMLGAVQRGELEYSKATLIARAPATAHVSLLRSTIEEEWTQDQLKAQIAALREQPDELSQQVGALRKKLTPKRITGLSTQKRARVEALLRELQEVLG